VRGTGGTQHLLWGRRSREARTGVLLPLIAMVLR